MAGKEYRAKSRTVQKMSRDGLVEEDLHTGKSRRAVTGRIDAIRIGDRPMEDLSGSGGQPGREPGAENARLGRHGLEGQEETVSGTFRGSSFPDDREDERSRNSSKRRMDKGRESSAAEAPSSMESPQDGYPDAWPEGLPDDYFGGTQEDPRYADRFRQDTHKEALREGRGLQTGVRRSSGRGYGSFPDEDSPKDRSRRQTRRMQQRYAVNRREGNFSGESPDSLPQADTSESFRTEQDQRAAGEEKDSGFERDEDYESGSTSGETAGSDPGRLRHARGHPAAREAAGYASNYRGGKDKEKGWADALRDENSHGGSRLRDSSSELDGIDSLRDEIASKRKRERLNQEQRKSGDASRLAFDDEGGMVRGSGTGFSHRGTSRGSPVPDVGTASKGAAAAAGKAVGIGAAAVRTKLSEAAAEDDNAAAKAALDTELTAERSVRSAASRASRLSGRRNRASRQSGESRSSARLLFTEQEDIKAAAGSVKTEKEKKAAVRRFFKKQRQRRMIAAAKKEEKTIATVFREQQSAAARAASIVRDAVVKSRGALVAIGAVGVVFVLVSTSLASCGALIQGMSNSVISTTYPSTDEDIYAVENRYRELEAGLDTQIRRMQATHPTYDEFRFQIDEITHNPYHLISYFTAKYGQFTYEQVKDELEEIFREQYTLTTTGERNVTITETRTVHPGESLGEVTTSGYCPCEICCGPYAGGTAASGVYPMADYTIAVDAYNPFVPMGTHVIMNGIEYVVEDTGNFDRYGVQFDVFYNDHASAVAHGQQTCEAVLAEGGGIEELELTITRTVDRMSVVLTNHDLDAVLQGRMTEAGKVRYSFYNITYGNRDYLFDLNNLPKYGNASRDYTIPPEALSDERFARMIAEAEKHLGTPYVWGGSSPGGFDCSGFVCWVIDHCGNGWHIGRTTAEGIRQYCRYVSPEDARPGDIIFFEHTYECAGASHVGIYVGDGMMIHCGDPIQYTSINASYWQDHFMEFGRIP